MERKESKTFTDWVNKFHQAEPIINLSDEKYKVFKKIIERGDLFIDDNNDDDNKTIEI